MGGRAWRWIGAVATAAAVLAVAAAVAAAKMAMPRWDRAARQAAVVVLARATAIEERAATFEAVTVLKGAIPPGPFRAAPVVAHGCTGTYGPHFAVGTEVLLFLGGPADGLRAPVHHGGAWVDVRPERREEILRSAERLVALETLPPREPRIPAYLAALGSEHAFLRRAAEQVVMEELARPADAMRHEEALAALLDSPHMEARRTAALALRFARSDRALPGLLRLLSDERPHVHDAASMALATYDTEETVAALIEAARRPDLTARVLLDLRGSRRPEAGAARRAFLSHEDPAVRAAAARGHGSDARSGDLEVLDRLHALAADEVADVRIAALLALQWSPRDTTPPIVLAALRREGIDGKEIAAAVTSLRSLSRHDIVGYHTLAALRGAADAPALLAPALRNDGHAADDAVALLAAMDTPGARLVLGRARDGEFGVLAARLARDALRGAEGK